MTYLVDYLRALPYRVAIAVVLGTVRLLVRLYGEDAPEAILVVRPSDAATDLDLDFYAYADRRDAAHAFLDAFTESLPPR